MSEDRKLGLLRFFLDQYLSDVDRRIPKPTVDEIFAGLWFSAQGPDGDGADNVGDDGWETLLVMLDEAGSNS